MKKFFRFSNFIGACMCIAYYIFSSCAATITITGGNTTTRQLTLIDSKGNSAVVFDTVAGKSIKWKISKKSNVSSISAMAKKDSSDDLFKKPPHKKILSKSWKGTLENIKTLKEKLPGKETPQGYFVEDYYIEWKDKKDSTYKHDPRIQVKSR